MICPRCQSTEYYILQGRKSVRCKRCKRDFSETSGTIWKSSKIDPTRRQTIIDWLDQGKNPHFISVVMGIQYKTIWGIAKKLQEEWQKNVPESEPDVFLIGDVVSRINIEGSMVSAFVSGFVKNPRFVRVKDDNGKHRIWLKDNLVNEDDAVRRALAVTNGTRETPDAT